MPEATPQDPRTAALVEMHTLAIAIADIGSRFDIEFGCLGVVLNDGDWIDTAKPSADVDGMDETEREATLKAVCRAMRYLHLRGHIDRHPLFTSLIRFHDIQVPH